MKRNHTHRSHDVLNTDFISTLPYWLLLVAMKGNHTLRSYDGSMNYNMIYKLPSRFDDSLKRNANFSNDLYDIRALISIRWYSDDIACRYSRTLRTEAPITKKKREREEQHTVGYIILGSCPVAGCVEESIHEHMKNLRLLQTCEHE